MDRSHSSNSSSDSVDFETSMVGGLVQLGLTLTAAVASSHNDHREIGLCPIRTASKCQRMSCCCNCGWEEKNAMSHRRTDLNI
jgi:hypothetical protein